MNKQDLNTCGILKMNKERILPVIERDEVA